MKLTGLFIYPVKSLQGVSLEQSRVDALGLVHDRRFMVVDESGRFLSQRTLPRMAQVATAITEEHLILSAEGGAEHRVPWRVSGAPLMGVSVWGSHGLQAEECGAESADWLSEVLQTPCRLVRIGDAFDRAISKAGYARPGDRVAFADAFPFLIAGEESLLDLNQRIQE
ncbi:MAG TPA: MOSC N-terminal beta barrel domain-containing protein, partial [Opitutaceae bacterium]|nr:MOSC N-terminal beta barrel domain-containing protein [Opitutaceae bacterium]